MPGKATIIGPGQRVVRYEGTPTVRELLLEQGVFLAAPCGGRHTCGKCRVICSGMVSGPTEEELARLTEEELASGVRLACCAKAEGDFEVRPPQGEISALSMVKLPEHDLTGHGWGAAVDIGTTTVAMRLYRLEAGRLGGESLGANRQEVFGADVISRIDYGNKNGAEALVKAIRDQIRGMLTDCMAQAGADRLDGAVITGNTVMLHFWEGLDAGGIAVAPFIPSSLFGRLSVHTLAGAPVYLPPCVGPYIGGDITCAVLASGMDQRPERTTLLVDLGTNGEIVLFHKGRYLCASTAMGPAFEGAGLTFGMQALPGAVSAVRLEGNGGLSVRTIGDRVPTGICGSGVLDAVYAMLRMGLLDETGLLDEESAEISAWHDQRAWQIPGTEVFITQKDVRQVQLAKAALRAGIETLLDAAGLEPGQVDRLYIAGGFGHYMDLSSAAGVGLFPPALAERAEVIGNGALAGAVLLLLDSAAFGRLRRILATAEELPLSGNRAFSDRYIENIMFE